MRLSRLGLIALSISPVISIYRGWQTTQDQVRGLLSNEEAQRQLLTNVIFAGAVYLALIGGCVYHMSQNARMGMGRKGLWTVGMVLFPIGFVPAYMILHLGRRRTD